MKPLNIYFLPIFLIVASWAPDAHAQTKYDLNICGGSDGGTYLKVASDIAGNINKQDKKGLPPKDCIFSAGYDKAGLSCESIIK